jgi:anti-anti-sigma factor
MLNVRGQRLGNDAVLYLRGRIVTGATHVLRRAVEEASDVSVLVLDFARVSGIDAHGLGMLLELRRQLQSKGTELKLMNVPRLVGEVLEITKLNTVLELTTETETRRRARLQQNVNVSIQIREELGMNRSTIEQPAIVRIWRGRTRRDRADEYEMYNYEAGIKPLLNKVLGVQTFRDDREIETEFMTISYWENLEAVRKFTGGDATTVHHLERDEEFLIELPKEVQIFRLLKSHGIALPEREDNCMDAVGG